MSARHPMPRGVPRTGGRTAQARRISRPAGGVPAGNRSKRFPEGMHPGGRRRRIGADAPGCRAESADRRGVFLQETVRSGFRKECTLAGGAGASGLQHRAAEQPHSFRKPLRTVCSTNMPARHPLSRGVPRTGGRTAQARGVSRPARRVPEENRSKRFSEGMRLGGRRRAGGVNSEAEDVARFDPLQGVAGVEHDREAARHRRVVELRVVRTDDGAVHVRTGLCFGH